MSSVLPGLGMTFIDVIVERRSELFEQLLEHLQLTFGAMALAVTAGVALGILLTRFRKLATPALGVASVVQTVPSLALLALMIPLFGIGVMPAIVALFIYAVLPILRNTYTAIDEVDPAIIEVGHGMGMTEWQILWRVQIPMCVPVMMAGVRTSTVICVGIATLCTFIGAGGLGSTIMDGMHLLQGRYYGATGEDLDRQPPTAHLGDVFRNFTCSVVERHPCGKGGL